MQCEMNRIYRQIIKEVLTMVESESERLYIDNQTLKELEMLWYRNLSHYLENAPVININSDSSDDSDDSDNKYTNNMMCLYDKVTKSKTRWKCNLKQGFINIGTRDYAFNTAVGDLDW